MKMKQVRFIDSLENDAKHYSDKCALIRKSGKVFSLRLLTYFASTTDG